MEIGDDDDIVPRVTNPVGALAHTHTTNLMKPSTDSTAYGHRAYEYGFISHFERMETNVPVRPVSKQTNTSSVHSIPISLAKGKLVHLFLRTISRC